MNTMRKRRRRKRERDLLLEVMLGVLREHGDDSRSHTIHQL